jgi:hypothetical protein
MSAKFPRIPHLPFSPGATPDDERLADVRNLLGYPVVLMEKMDGANVCLTSETVYARTHSGPATGRQFNELKAHHAAVRHLIPPRVSIFAEWCYAIHTVEYRGDEFPRLFVIGVRDDEHATWAGLPYLYHWGGRLGCVGAPLMDVQSFETILELEGHVIECAGRRSHWGDRVEGVVVRPLGSVADDLFGSHVAKYVNEDFKPGTSLPKSTDFLWQPGRIPG